MDEFKIQTRSLGLRADSPKSAHKKGGVLAQFHGRLYENWRNDVLDAIPHEIVQRGGEKSILRRNQFGFNVSGPVVIPKLYNGGRRTFFSLSYEGVRERISRSYLRTIPTVGERTGDFSGTVNASGVLLPIFDPATTRRNPAFNPSAAVAVDNLEYLRDPFPGNRIASNRLDPVAAKAISYYPGPNATVGPFNRNNFFIVSPEGNAANGIIAKVDHSVSDKHRLSVSLSSSNGLHDAANYFQTAADPGASNVNYSNRSLNLDYVFTFSANTLNTLSVGASSSVSSAVPAKPADYAAELGLKGIHAPSFPVFSFAPYLHMGQSGPTSKTASNSLAFTDVFSTRHGKHSIRLIGQFILYQINAYAPGSIAGAFSFDSGLTSLPGINDTGHSFASFLLGMPSYASTSLTASPSYYRNRYGLISVRESYEVRKNLTLSISLDLMFTTPRVEKYDRQSTVDLTAINPENGLPGAMIVAGRDGVGRSFQPMFCKLQPSGSFAWNPGGNTKMVVRGAFSRSYSGYPIYGAQWGTQAFNGTPNWSSLNSQLEPVFLLSDGVPPPPHPYPNLSPAAVNDMYADLFDRSRRQPTYQSASLSAERELPGAMLVSLTAAYSGGKSMYTGDGTANPNAIPLSALVYRDQLNEDKFRRTLRPYPQYRGFNLYYNNPVGRYNRNSASVRAEKRTSKGLSLTATYEWSKQMDNYSGPYGTQDFYNLRKEWSLTPGSNAHRLSLSYLYELPLGPNRTFLAYPDWRRHLVAGWSVSGTATMIGGDPIYLRPEFNNTGGVVQALHVNAVPGVEAKLSNPGPDLWFNPAAFDQPADFTIGNVSRTHPTLRQPGSLISDLSITKRFSLAPDRSMEFSALGVNFLNHANWNDPDVMIGPSYAPNVNAGRIIGSHGGRVLQLGMRFSF
ncbi:MAG: hypothetical protein NTY38_13130 [Acidobacteria bacterium]|nr:hypothetical protein [Acidobacteriota bacterium]